MCLGSVVVAQGNVTEEPNSTTTTEAPNTTTTEAPNTTEAQTTTTTTTTLPPGATPAPTTEAPVCEPSCRVNLYFSSFLQTPNNIQASLVAVATAAGVATVARVQFNTRHNVYSGIPYGNGTLVTVTIESFPQGVCNNYTNQQACDTLVNRSNAPNIAPGLQLVGVTNGTRIPADATIPTFGLLASVSSLYLALYCGSGLGYLLFLVWSAYKFLVAFQLMMNERARDAAEKIGLTLEEAEQLKRDEDEKAAQSKKKGGARRVPRPGLPLQQSEDQYGDAYATTDVDDPAKQSLEHIVSRMKLRTSQSFREQEYNREVSMHREMVPRPSRAVLEAVAGASLPPVHVPEVSNRFSIQHGGLVEDMDLPAAVGRTADRDGEGNIHRRLPKVSESGNGASSVPSILTAHQQPISVAPASAAEQEIDKLL